ncbi:MAG: protease inhibitor I42 family protein [Anaerolineales bacterium]
MSIQSKLISILLGLVLLLTAGCGRQTISLDAAANGQTIEMTLGQRLTIALPANPSTGYTWEIQQGATPVLDPIGEPAFTSDNPGLVGSGGTLRLTFRAAQTGVTTLVLVYHRPWETDVEPLDTFQVTVTVR